MTFEQLGYLTALALALVGLLIIIAALCAANVLMLNKLLESLGGWPVLAQFRRWERNKQSWFVIDRNEWLEQARVIVRGHTMDPESHYTEITINALYGALANGELNMPSPVEEYDPSCHHP